ncbi:hypothetical protein [Corynebacterium hylobatis]|uniref:hypothetical protein n=1 Tax=Corynebacterium hylobatis TaxID=1859290 RepID=UPI0019D15147|nr:hypothetical protein [Corynebacterium hylobatis]
MNTATLKMALSAASAISARVKEYNEKKTREAYELLSDAASRVDLDDLRSRGEALIDEGRREAGQVTQAAHARLDSAKKRLEKAADNRPSKQRARAAKRRRTFTLVGLSALTLSAVAGAVYWYLRQQPEPGDTPPRVEDFSGAGTADEKAAEAEATLVYSTTTGDPEEGVPAEVDEELMQSLDEQLEKHRSAAMDEAGEDAEEIDDTEEEHASDAPVAGTEEFAPNPDEDGSKK